MNAIHWTRNSVYHCANMMCSVVMFTMIHNIDFFLECLNYSRKRAVHWYVISVQTQNEIWLYRFLSGQLKDKSNYESNNTQLFWQNQIAQADHTMASISKQVFLNAIHFNTLRERIFMGKSIYRKMATLLTSQYMLALRGIQKMRVFSCWTEERVCVDPRKCTKYKVNGNKDHLENVLVLTQHRKNHAKRSEFNECKHWLNAFCHIQVVHDLKVFKNVSYLLCLITASSVIL